MDSAPAFPRAPMVSRRWREIQRERLEEAVAGIAAIDGVVGVVVGGSVGRDQAWPLSDIDLVPILRNGSGAMGEVNRLQSRLVDWWAASGQAQTLDVGRIAFTVEEVRDATSLAPDEAAGLLDEPRWLHGLDKVHGGHGRCDADGLAGAMASWATAIRFHPAVREARAGAALREVISAQRAAEGALARADDVEATQQVRVAARDVRLVYVERWSERLGSLGREWTRFQRLAAKHWELEVAERLERVAGASVHRTAQLARHAPEWMKERIDLAYQARVLIGEDVSEAESRRDQMAAFAHLLARRESGSQADWLGVPDPDVADALAELRPIVSALERPR